MTGIEATKRFNYVLASNWAVYRYDNTLWTRRLWAKDLEMHFRYIDVLTLVCPVISGKPPEMFSPIPNALVGRIRLVKVSPFHGRLDRLLKPIPYLFQLAKALRTSEVFHFTIAEHPILFGLVIPVLRRFSKVGTVGVVESSFWRNPKVPVVGKLLARINELGAKLAVSNAHASFVTQPEYIKSLTNPKNSNHVAPAVWADESVFVKQEDLIEVINSRSSGDEGIKVAFFGQLRPEKGPDLAVAACIRLLESGKNITLDIYGQGPLLEELRLAAVGHEEHIRFQGYLAYGADFFRRMRSYHANLVPNRSDELPRIVFDTFSQAVPVVASKTPGLEFVKHAENGMKFNKGDSEDLARVLSILHEDKDLRTKIAIGARDEAEHYTHEAMHSHRASVLREVFPEARQIMAFQ